MEKQETLNTLRKWGFLLGPVGLACGIWIGSCNGPERVIEKEKIVESKKTKEENKEKEVVVDKKEEKKDEVKIQWKERIVIVKPDGTRIEKESTKETDAKTEVKVETKIVEKEKIVYKDVIVTKEVEKYKETINRKNWDVSVKVGLGVTDFKLSPQAPYLTPVILGVGVDRRVVGPFKAGLWIQTKQFSDFSAGLSLGLEF